MALKSDRTELFTDISFFMNATGERGSVLVHSTAGSGAAMDDANAQVVRSNSQSGLPAGILLNDVVDLDLTRQHVNFHKDEMQVGGKVTILRQGTVVTNLISGTPTVGQVAHFDANGNLTAGSVDNGVQVGRWLSIKDTDGYAKCSINIT